MNTRGLASLAATTCLAAATLAMGMPAMGANTVTLSGKATLKGAPVKDASVTVYVFSDVSGAWINLSTTTTDGAGAYSFRVEPGTYQLRVAGDGKQFITTWHQSAPGQKSATSLEVSADQRVNLPVIPASHIMGAVKTKDGKPVPRVRVKAFDRKQGLRYYAKANKDGSFDVPVAAGTYRLSTVDRPTMFGALRSGVKVGSGDDRKGQNLRMPPASSIVGTITNPESVYGIQVIAHGISKNATEAKLAKMRSDSNDYVIGPLKAGTYKVQFDCAGECGFATQWFKNSTTKSDAKPVELFRGEQRSGIDATLAK